MCDSCRTPLKKLFMKCALANVRMAFYKALLTLGCNELCICYRLSMHVWSLSTLFYCDLLINIVSLTDVSLSLSLWCDFFQVLVCTSFLWWFCSFLPLLVRFVSFVCITVKISLFIIYYSCLVVCWASCGGSNNLLVPGASGYSKHFTFCEWVSFERLPIAQVRSVCLGTRLYRGSLFWQKETNKQFMHFHIFYVFVWP